MAKKILVVDNHPVMLRMLANLLIRHGHEVRTAEDGLGALDVLKSYVPDIIFVDLVMPNISGEKLCRIIRNMPHLQKVFLVIVSAVAVEENLDFVALGADACIAKGGAESMARHVSRVIEMASLIGGPQEEPPEILGREEVATRQISRELLSSRRHLEVILDNIVEGILEVGRDRKVIFVNPAAVRLIGVPEEELLGADLASVAGGVFMPWVGGGDGALSESLARREVAVSLNRRQVVCSILPVELPSGGSTTIVIIREQS
ncbi:MAG: response regulator [Thermodesulfobacteriota bacterium]